MRSQVDPLSSSSPKKIHSLCKDQQQRLLAAIKTAAKQLGMPSETEGGSPLTVQRLAREEADLVEALDPEDFRYKRNVISYLSYLATANEDLETEDAFKRVLAPSYPETKDDSELATLFRKAYAVMPPLYQGRRCFSFEKAGETFNFTKPLQLIFRIHLLQLACLREPGFSLAWLQEQYAALKAEVDILAQTLGSQNKEQIKFALSVAPVASTSFSTAVSEADAAIQAYAFVEDDTYDLADPYGDVAPSLMPWFFYWDAIDIFLGNPTGNQLQMRWAQHYPWRERVLYFIFGRDVRKYLKDTRRWLAGGIAIFNNVVARHYHSGFNLRSTLAVAWMAGNLLAMLFNDVPLALLKGLLSLPLRLMQSVMNKVTMDDSFSRKSMGFLLSGTDVILTAVLYVGLRIPVSLAMVPLRFGLGVVTALVFPIVMTLARQVGRLFMFAENKKTGIRKGLSDTYLKLRVTLQRELESNPEYKHAVIADRAITVLELDGEHRKYQANQSQDTVTELTAILDQQKAFILDLQKEAKQSSPVRQVMLGPTTDDPSFQSIIKNSMQKDAVAALTLDWQFYSCQARPTVREVNEIAAALAMRSQPLKKFRLLGAELNLAALTQIADAFIYNPALQPEEISFNVNQVTEAELTVLLRLVTKQPSIQYIPSVLDELNDVPVSVTYLQFCSQLKKNREKAGSIVSAVVPHALDSSREKKHNSLLARHSFLNEHTPQPGYSQLASNQQQSQPAEDKQEKRLGL